jgi:hypothetical protein
MIFLESVCRQHELVVICLLLVYATVPQSKRESMLMALCIFVSSFSQRHRPHRPTRFQILVLGLRQWSGVGAEENHP